MYRKAMLLFAAMFFAVSLCSCHIQQGLVEYPERESATKDMAVRKKENDIEKAVKEKHEAPELSGGFIGHYIDEGDFYDNKANTLNGIARVYSTADMTEGEIALWKEIIDSKSVEMKTTDDIQRKTDEINAAIDALAAKNSMTMEEYVGQTKFGMTAPDVEAFVGRQAKKFLEQQARDEAAMPGGSLGGAAGTDSAGGIFGGDAAPQQNTENAAGTGVPSDTAPRDADAPGSMIEDAVGGM